MFVWCSTVRNAILHRFYVQRVHEMMMKNFKLKKKKFWWKSGKKTDEKNSDEINSNENNQIKKSNKKLMQIKIVPHNFASGKDENCEYLLVFN